MDTFIGRLGDESVYRRAMGCREPGPSRDRAVKYMETMTHRRLAQIILARFLLLDLFVQEARQSRRGLLPKEHRRLWVYLQVYPGLFDRSRTMLFDDLFMDLAQLLKDVSLVELKQQLPVLRRKVGDLLPEVGVGDRAPYFSVLDEAQAAIPSRRERPSQSVRCGLLREWIRFNVDVFSHEDMRLVLAGTGMDAHLLKNTLATPTLKDEPFKWINDIGAFNDPESQARYIKRYIPAPWTKPQWRHLLERAWNWLRGR
jgi:hypothetical protein